MIAIKPHHFVDIVTTLGDRGVDFGPHPYGHAVHRVAGEILEHRDVELRMELGADDICRPCCHNIYSSPLVPRPMAARCSTRFTHSKRAWASSHSSSVIEQLSRVWP